MVEPLGVRLRPAAPLLSPAICGKGTFLLTAGGERIGQESFEIECTAGGFAGRGRTQLTAPGLAMDIATTLDVDDAGRPRRTTATGTAQGITVDQTLVVEGASAVLTSSGARTELPFPTDAALLPSNIFYQLQFLLARYDALRGGVQQIPTLPSVRVDIDYRGRNEVTAAGPGAGGSSSRSSFDRYHLHVAGARNVIWVDQAGRVALVAVPAQQFVAVCEEYAAYVEPLHAALAEADAAAAKAATPPDYSAPPDAPFTAEEVTVRASGYTLAGTLLLPKAGRRPLPAAVLITGSGQQTRDEAIPLPGLERYRPFRQIAEGLASAGVAVLRVDDRGVGGSTGRETLADATTSSFAADVRAQLAYLLSRREIDPDRIVLIGHSEGGAIAAIVAASDPRVAGIVLMGTAARRGDAVLVEQLEDALDRAGAALTAAQREAARAQQREIIARVRAGQEVSGLSGSAWLKEFIDYDPLLDVRKVRQPILILHGALDRQVTVDQAAMLERAAREAGNGDVTVSVFPRLNHLFLEATTGAVAEYSSLPSTTVGGEVIRAISDWLRARLRTE